MNVFIVWVDSDPGYAAAHLLGVFATREMAEKRLAEANDPDAGIIELRLGASADVELR